MRSQDVGYSILISWIYFISVISIVCIVEITEIYPYNFWQKIRESNGWFIY